MSKKPSFDATEPAAKLGAVLGLLPAIDQEPAPEINPYMREMVVKTKTRRALIETGALTNPETGEEYGTEFNAISSVDNAIFVKVFRESLRQFFDLDQPGFRLWVLIAKQLTESVGRGDVYLHPAEICKKKTVSPNGAVGYMSRAAFYRGLTTLKEAGFIREQRKPGWYWFNPSMFFCGDRIKFSRTFILKKPGLSTDDLPRVITPDAAAKKPRQPRQPRQRKAAA